MVQDFIALEYSSLIPPQIHRAKTFSTFKPPSSSPELAALPSTHQSQLQLANNIMSRSAADATRFTATSPHAYANPTSINRASPSTYSASSTRRPNPNARTPPPPTDPKKGNAPPAETPAEKVARLRQARLREREAQTTTWDRLVVRGRVWADKAHRITIYTLVGFSSAYKPPSTHQRGDAHATR